MSVAEHKAWKTSHSLQPFYDFFGQPVSLLARAVLLLGLLAIPFVFRDPLWTMSFRSNQYPDPLRMSIHIDHLEGQKTPSRDDLREINSLNHYIGMKPLMESDFSEFQWMPLAIGIFVLLALRIIAIGRLRDLLDLTVLFLYFGLYSAWDFYKRLYDYGHILDPEAAITVDPFMPPMYGSVKVANFWVESYPGGGSYAMAVFGLMLVISLAIAFWRGLKWYRQSGGSLGTFKAKWAAITVAVGSLLLSLFPLESQAAVFEVGGQGQPAILREALALASDGDRIVLSGGRHEGPLVIVRSIVLEGKNGAVVEGNGHGNVILVTADDVTVQGLTIRGSGREMMDSESGIKVNGSRALISGNVLDGNLFGVYLGNCGSAIVEDNLIRGPTEVGIGSRGAGIHLYNAHHNVIRRNDVAGVRDGVYFDHADYNLVEDNEFSELRYGVHYMYCKDNNFYRNTFRDSVAGVAIMYTDNVNFSDNQIINNRNGYNAFGLLFQACRNCVAERNVIVNNTQGIFLEGARDNVFRNNLVAYNDVAVYVFGSSSNNAFESNDFVGNLSMLQTVGRTDICWSEPGQGNYYADYEGYDLDEDGVGDVSHKLQDAFEALEGNHPLLRLYLSSAAADALRLAERSFPLLPMSNHFDDAPSMKPVSGVGVSPGLSGGLAGSLYAALGCLILSLSSVFGYMRLGR